MEEAVAKRKGPFRYPLERQILHLLRVLTAVMQSLFLLSHSNNIISILLKVNGDIQAGRITNKEKIKL